MLVCHCHAVSDREIRQCAEAGARTCEDVQRACRAGGTCRGCIPHVEMLLTHARTHDATPRMPQAAAS